MGINVKECSLSSFTWSHPLDNQSSGKVQAWAQLKVQEHFTVRIAILQTQDRGSVFVALQILRPWNISSQMPGSASLADYAAGRFRCIYPPMRGCKQCHDSGILSWAHAAGKLWKTAGILAKTWWKRSLRHCGRC